MRGRPFLKGQVPHNKTPSYTFTCQTCGKTFIRREAYLREVGVPKTCSRICHNRRIAAEAKTSGRLRGTGNPKWRGGIQIYRRFRKDACERCGAKSKLIVHHKNEDRYDNRLDNLETLCRRCHQM